jgi:hypothetical protein
MRMLRCTIIRIVLIQRVKIEIIKTEAIISVYIFSASQRMSAKLVGKNNRKESSFCNDLALNCASDHEASHG